MTAGRAAGWRSERGLALFVTLALGVLLSAMAVGLLFVSTTDVQIAAAFRRGVEARWAAEAGAHRAVVELASLPDWDGVLDGTVRSAFVDGPAGGLRTVRGADPVDLDHVRSLADCGHAPPCSDAELDALTLLRPWGGDNPRWQLFAHAPLGDLLPSGAAPSPYYVVVLAADDPAESDGNPARDEASPAPGAGVLRLRSEAFGPAGAHGVVELVVARPGAPVPALRLLGWRLVN